MLNRYLALIQLLLLLLLHYTVYSQSVYIKHYTTNDGLAGNHVYMSHQDNNGYIWIATTSGLSRFDGRKFKTYDYENGLQDNEVLIVTNDVNNNIWVNTFSAIPSISVIKKDSVKNYPYTSIRGSANGINISDEYYSKRHKTAYLSGLKTLLIIKEDAVPVAKRAPLLPVFRVFETEDGYVFGGDGNNLYQVRDTTISHFQSLGLPQPAAGQSYFNGNLFISVGNTIMLYDYNTDQFVFSHSATLKGKVRLIHADKYGLWVTYTNKPGLFLFRDHGITGDPIEVRIPGFVNYFMNDGEGGVWISTTDNGIFYLPSPGIISYAADDGLKSSVITALDIISEDTLWVGNNIGDIELVTINKDKIGISKIINLGSDQHSNNFIIDITHDKSKNIYVQSRNNLSRLYGTKLDTVLATGANKSLLLINDTLLGIGAWTYQVLNLRTGEFKVDNIGRIYAQAVDANYNLWLGGIRGLFHKQLFGIKEPYQLRGLQDIKINALIAYDGYIWAGTQNNGLFLVKDDSIYAQFTFKNTPGLPSNTIKALAMRGDELWIGTNRGLLCARFDAGNLEFFDKVLLDHNDGLLSPEINKLRVFDSSVFIASYGGITVFDKIIHKHLNYTLADCFVKNLNDDKLYNHDSVTIPYSTKGIEIGFQTVAFRYNSEITYSYRLEPFDNEWKTTKDNLLQYTNIPPGEYVFKIHVRDGRGNSSQLIKAVHIKVTPLFWQTIWFKGLLGFVIIMCVAIVLYWYYRYTQRRTNDKLQQSRIIAKAKLEALRAQLKPHFIFNSLNAIKDYIYNNKNDDAANLLQGFARLVRKGLYLANNDFTTIGEEISFLKQYLELEQVKCDYCFDYHIEVSEKITNIVIPSLITQPFVENAVIHGVRSVKDERAVLLVTYSLVNDDVVCCIADNGIGIKRSLQHKKDDSSRGTMLSKDRISYFRTGLGVDIVLEIFDISETGQTKTGTTIMLTIKNALNLLNNEDKSQNADS